jgi:acetylornithine deacetylase/succinyl-diaminopimelate desuccinylase-like protein
METGQRGGVAEPSSEQGPILEDAGAQIGVVLGGQAYRWFDVHISGRESHAGSTPLDVRADPLLCAARLMELANTVARDLSGVATTGILSLRPGSINTIPGTVDLTLDIRHISDEKLDEMEARILDEAEGITKRLGTNGCSIEWKKTFQKAPVMFHDDCVGAITEAAERHLGEGGAQTIYSGAGHDR